MASGEFAEPIYRLLDELGCNSEKLVLGELIAYLTGDSIRDFVEHFRKNHDMSLNDNDVEEASHESNDYVMCLDCQDTYHEDDAHECVSSSVKPSFFSSLIPEC